MQPIITWCRLCLINIIKNAIVNINIVINSNMRKRRLFRCVRLTARVTVGGSFVITLVKTTTETLPLTFCLATRLFNYTRNTAFAIRSIIVAKQNVKFGPTIRFRTLGTPGRLAVTLTDRNTVSIRALQWAHRSTP